MSHEQAEVGFRTLRFLERAHTTPASIELSVLNKVGCVSVSMSASVCLCARVFQDLNLFLIDCPRSPK